MHKFSQQDAINLVTVARRAPLQNMAEAKAVNELLKRFTEFFAAQTNATAED